MDREVNLLRMNELANAYVACGDSLLEEDANSEYFNHMLHRSVTLMSRIAECSGGKDFSGGKEYEWDEKVAAKLWLKEAKEQFARFADGKAMPKAALKAINAEIDAALVNFKDVEPKDVDPTP